jgi:enoyl-CoA hydratase/carnithine racemase
MPDILIDVEDRIATITLNRPDRLNAYTVAMGSELFGALRRLDLDDDVRAIVVTGAGRAFCAGADLEAGGATFAGDRAWDLDERATWPWNMRTPVIAAINGPAVGIGATLPLRWDIRLASDRARIGFVFARRGVIPEAGSTWLLPRIVGVSVAAELMLTGRIVDAGEARDLGLVSRVVPHDDLMATARALATEIAAHTSPVAVAITKRLLWRQLMEPDAARGKALEDELFYWAGKQADAAEGVTAFLAKREPAWVLRKSRDVPEGLPDL